MNRLTAKICAGMILMLTLEGSHSNAGAVSRSTPSSLCTTLVGPAFAIADESRETIAVHAGQFLGISFAALGTGQAEGQIQVRQPLLAASMPRGGFLTLAESEDSGIKISTFDVAHRKATSTQAFAGLTAQLAVFTPNEKYLLGVTNAGGIFRIDARTKKVDVIEGAVANAISIGVSPTSAKLYVAGDALTVIDIDRMSVHSTVTRETHLLEVAVSPDDHTLALRNRHNIELFDLVKGEVSASIVVDPMPDVVSLSSGTRLIFAPDGSALFYARASNTESELLSLSLNPPQIETRWKVGPYPNAIAVVPGRHWILLITGLIGREQIEAFDMKTHAVKFSAALVRESSSKRLGQDRCPK